MPDLVWTSAEIKLTIGDGVESAIDALHLGEGTPWEIFFCEDLSPTAGTPTPLLDAGVILRARREGGDDHDATVKLRPAEPALITDRWREEAGSGIQAEEDWTGGVHVLTVSAGTDLTGSPIAAAGGVGGDAVALWSPDQLAFLTDCSRLSTVPDGLTLLGPVRAVRWKHVPHDGELDLKAERWTLDDIDFLELSTTTDLAGAPHRQQLLQDFADAAGLDTSRPPAPKTSAVLRHLVDRARGTPA